MKYSAFLVSVFFLYMGCVSSKTPNAIDRCVRFKTDPIFEKLYGKNTNLNFYNIVQDAETIFIDSGLLANPSKEAYIDFLDIIYSNNKLKIYEVELIKEYSGIIGLMIIDVVSECPMEVVVNHQNNLSSSIVKQFFLSQDLEKSGYSHVDVKEYVNQINKNDFRTLPFRAPILAMILFEIRNKNKNVNDLVFPDLPKN